MLDLCRVDDAATDTYQPPADHKASSTSRTAASPTRRGRLVASALALLVTGAVGAGLAAPPAAAESLPGQQNQVSQQITLKGQDLTEASTTRAATDRAVAADKKQEAELQTERSRVDARIAAQNTTAQAASSSPTPAATSSSISAAAAHHGFIYPVKGRISSRYGMRFHPVLHYWKLHDGTDFAAKCGTPIRAAYSGKVTARYYNKGYGYRLFINHGRVSGHNVTTSYNHASRYVVKVGKRVRRGQVIGYVGATGYATGCHLHLMLWKDGKRINPMSWY